MSGRRALHSPGAPRWHARRYQPFPPRDQQLGASGYIAGGQRAYAVGRGWSHLLWPSWRRHRLQRSRGQPVPWQLGVC